MTRIFLPPVVLCRSGLQFWTMTRNGELNRITDCTPQSTPMSATLTWFSTQMLGEQLTAREKEAEERLREGLVRQEAEMSAEHAARTKAAAEKSAKAVELHRQETAALRAR